MTARPAYKTRGTIDALPADLRRSLDEWLRANRLTHGAAAQRLNEYLAERGATARVSRDAVGRYDRRMRAVGGRLREARAAAEAWIGKLGAAPQGQVGLLVNEILRTLAFDISLELQEGELNKESLPATIAQLKQLSLAAQRLETAAATNVAREREVRRLAAEDLARRAESAAGAGRPITPERLRAIVREAYGVG